MNQDFSDLIARIEHLERAERERPARNAMHADARVEKTQFADYMGFREFHREDGVPRVGIETLPRRGGFPWKVTRTESGVSVAAGIRAVIGGEASVNPETNISLTESQLSAGVYLVKQFSGESGEWTEGIQAIDDLPEDSEMTTQKRVIAFVSGSEIRQYAVGTIYAIAMGDPPEESGPAEWVLVGVIRAATSADVDDDETLVLGQPLVSYRYVWAGSEIEYKAMAPFPVGET
jgi:hypothetical protein